MARVVMDGLKELQAKLAELADATNIKKDALTESGEHLRQAMVEAVPKKTGKLKESIAMGEIVEDKVQIGPSQQGPSYRAHFIEFGTSKMRAQPFIRPTFEREKKTIEKIMAEQIKKGLGI